VTCLWLIVDKRLVNYRYEASADGYDAKQKRQELFDPESRFVVLGSPPVAYAVFRFDTEVTAADRDAEVVYWYGVRIY